MFWRRVKIDKTCRYAYEGYASSGKTRERIINAYLKRGIVEISATDWMAAPQYAPVLGEMYAIFVTGNYDEVKAVFDKLEVGAEKDRFQELHQMPFGM